MACAQNLKSVSTMSTQDPYVKAKLLVDGYQVGDILPRVAVVQATEWFIQGSESGQFTYIFWLQRRRKG